MAEYISHDKQIDEGDYKFDHNISDAEAHEYPWETYMNIEDKSVRINDKKSIGKSIVSKLN